MWHLSDLLIEAYHLDRLPSTPVGDHRTTSETVDHRQIYAVLAKKNHSVAHLSQRLAEEAWRKHLVLHR